MVRSEPANTLANSSVVAEDLSHSYPPPHTPGYLHRALASGRRAVFPVTKGKHSGNGEDECSPLAGQTGGGSVPGASSVAAAWSPVVTIVDNNNNNPAVPIIQVIDCSADINTNTSAAANGCDGAGRSDVQQQQQQQTSIAAWTKPGGTQHTEAETTTVPTTKTATIITPPHSSHRVHLPQQQQQQLPTSLPATAPQSRPESLHFPPVSRSTRTGRSTRTALTAGTNEDRKRLSSASSLWPGDPRAISSVRRDRRNIDEMLATMKSGEETRRLIREANPTCSRNCSKPNIMSQLGRAYINLPDLLPEIEKARQRMAEAEAAERELPAQDRQPLTASAEKRRSMGRFELEEEEITGSKNLPIYHIDYGSLRAVGGTRRNSVLAWFPRRQWDPRAGRPAAPSTAFGAIGGTRRNSVLFFSFSFFELDTNLQELAYLSHRLQFSPRLVRLSGLGACLSCTLISKNWPTCPNNYSFRRDRWDRAELSAYQLLASLVGQAGHGACWKWTLHDDMYCTKPQELENLS